MLNSPASFCIVKLPELLSTKPSIINPPVPLFDIVKLVPPLTTLPVVVTLKVTPLFTNVAVPLLLVTLPLISKSLAPDLLVIFRAVPSLITSPSAPTISLPLPLMISIVPAPV